MNLHCLSFFQSQKIKIMSDSCHFHGSFMALSHTSLTWVQSAKIYWKSYPKSRCWLSICFFCLISTSFLAICQIHVGFMALSWHFHGAFFLLIFIVFPNSFMALACQIHGRFIADSSRIHASFFQSQKIKIMSLSWQFHGSFMALSHTSLTWVQSAKIYWKKFSKKSVLVVDLVFLPNFSFIFGNMSDSCRFHGPFMALSWHFLPSDFDYFFLKKIQTNNWIHLKNDRLASMSDSSQIHRGFMALSCHFHGTFLSASQLCRIHRGFMSLSWQFHGTFTYKPYLGTVCQNLLEKLSKKSVLVVDLFFLPNFSFIFGSMSDSCRFHGPFMALFMALSSSWFLLFFQTVSWHLHGRFMADSSRDSSRIHASFFPIPKNQNHVTFMALSWRFHGPFLALSWHFSLWACLDLPWKCHESAMNLPNLDETYMSDSYLFVSVYFCLFVVSVFFWCYFHWWFLRFRLINFFWGFLWSKHRVIRNTQTTNPNPQLVFSWVVSFLDSFAYWAFLGRAQAATRAEGTRGRSRRGNAWALRASNLDCKISAWKWTVAMLELCLIFQGTRFFSPWLLDSQYKPCPAPSRQEEAQARVGDNSCCLLVYLSRAAGAFFARKIWSA